MTAPFGAYVHVPFCAKRCGYCDFNTYTPAELNGQTGADQARYVTAVCQEINAAATQVPHELIGPGLATIFFGGGTPTMLSDAQLAHIIDHLRQRWGVRAGAEVSLEANPDTVTAARAQAWAASGVTRVSLGVQSSVREVLQRLDRTHRHEGITAAVAAVRAAGLGVSVDLIYGTPGESVAQWRESVTAALAWAPDHVSAYALTIEPGTAMFRRHKAGEFVAVDGDDQAEKYQLADDLFRAAGYHWYEISNWAKTAADRSQHNLGYWTGGNWWGFGPGAHSHLPGRRWWNVKHPARYAQAVAAGEGLVAGTENLNSEDQEIERVMLRIRTVAGIYRRELPAALQQPDEVIAQLAADGLITTDSEQITLTRSGRLLADTVTHRLLGH